MKKPASAPKLMRYIEWMSRGRRTGRVAYLLKEWDLPQPLPGAEWVRDSKFNAAEELLADPSLNDAYRVAIDKGIFVERSKD
jgi:hypothetical protein